MKRENSDKYGINMKRYCREHEAWVEKVLREEGASKELLELHQEKIALLQHERLIHLIVVVMTVIGELFAADLTLLHPESFPFGVILLLILTVLLGFYFAHYFFLENTTQHWYRIADEIWKEIKS